MLLDSTSSAFSHRKYSKVGVDLMGLKSSPLKHFLPNRRWSKYRNSATVCRTLSVVILAAVLLCIQLHTGIIEKCLLEIDFRSDFHGYPAALEDFPGIVQKYIESNDRVNFQPRPINLNYDRIKFYENVTKVLSDLESVGLLIIVKSASRNYRKRKSIRTTWGNNKYLQEHQMQLDLPTKVVFICGLPNDIENNSNTDLFIHEKTYGDIILANYHDTYGNNTFKTMLALRWALEQVKSFEYLMVADDDMYVNPANVIKFIKSIPKTNAILSSSGDTGVRAIFLEDPHLRVKSREMRIDKVFPLERQPLIMGQLCIDASPFRSILGFGSKWSVGIGAYPYNYFPPYIAGGATIFDKSTVETLYYGALFTQHFWVDDVFIGIIAHKLGISLTHNNLVASSYIDYDKLAKGFGNKFGEMIAIHGLSCPEQLVQLWNSQDLNSLSDCESLKIINGQ